jgi:uncharacterized protein YwgA
MKTRDFLLLAYKALGGNIRGRTLMQKEIYFLSKECKQELNYRPHYYGPYSADVAEANEELIAMNYLEERITRYGIDNRGFEMAQHNFELTDDGKKIARKVREENKQIWETIMVKGREMKEIIEELNINYLELSAAAKLHYLVVREGRLTKKRLNEMSKILEWKVNDSEIEKAEDFLMKMKLIKRRK